MSDIDEIRAKKLAELQNTQQQNAQEQAQEQMQMQQQIEQLEAIVKQVMTKEALERYGNLRTAFPEKAMQILVLLAQAIQQGQLEKVDDSTLKEILKKMTPKKKEFRIKRA